MEGKSAATLGGDGFKATKAVNRFPISRSIVTGCVAIFDILALVASGLAVYGMYVHPNASEGFLPYLSAIAVLVTFVLASFSLAGLYGFTSIIRPFRQMPRLIVLIGICFLVLIALGFLFKVTVEFSRVWTVLWAFLGTGLIIINRTGVPSLLRRLALKGQLTKNIIVFGAGNQGARLVQRIEDTKEPWTRVIGVFDDRLTRIDNHVHGKEVRNGLLKMIEFGREQQADEILIALPWSAEDRIVAIIKAISVLPAQVSLCPELTRRELLQPHAWAGSGIDHGMPVLTVLDKPVHGWSAVAKQALDSAMGVIFTSIALPLMAVIAVLIKLDSPGPVLFQQMRYGFNNKLIGVYKFRTMYADKSDQAAAKLTQRNDPRVTRVGAFLRRSSLDELPQLFNVLKGEMSVVGPRPHAVEAKAGGTLYEEVVDEYAVRHKVKPGITGWAQVNGWRGNTETEADLLGRVQHDLYYIDNWTILLDFIIILRTAWAVVKGENSY
jgi:Undecaprenyl-phosphate glucose phosphotransferase